MSTRAELLRKYKLTEDDYVELLDRQGGRCAICLTKPDPSRALAIDHDHETGRVRGLLCFACNTGLGKFQDDERRLQRAIRYLAAELVHAPDDDNWFRCITIDPAIRTLEIDILSHRAEHLDDDRYCANRTWITHFKPRVVAHAGWHAMTGTSTDPFIKTQDAYDAVYEHCYELLPDCRDCDCFLLG